MCGLGRSGVRCCTSEASLCAALSGVLVTTSTAVSRSTLSHKPERSTLDALFDSSEHVFRHDEVGGNDPNPAAEGQPPGAGRPSRTEVESRATTFVERCQDEDPRPVECCVCPPAHGQVAVRVHDECSFGFDLLDDETALGVWWAVRDERADVDVFGARG